MLHVESPENPVHEFGEIRARKRRCRHSRHAPEIFAAPGTVRNFDTVPARLGAVPAEPVPSGGDSPDN